MAAAAVDCIGILPALPVIEITCNCQGRSLTAVDPEFDKALSYC
jgi:hypothetical protein